MKKLILIIAISFLSTSCKREYLIDKDNFFKACEEAYFEGQKDALEKDIRIKKTNDSCWVWIKSPWDSNRAPIFNPNSICK